MHLETARRTLRPRPTLSGVRIRRSGVALACVVVALACPHERAVPQARARSVLLVVMDTVRADHVSCYGYERPTTPNLCSFAERADRYTNAFASSPWTLPSHASMFTGRLPFEHGAHLVFTDVPEENGRPFDGRFPTLVAGAVDGVAFEEMFVAQPLDGIAVDHVYLTPAPYPLSRNSPEFQSIRFAIRVQDGALFDHFALGRQ